LLTPEGNREDAARLCRLKGRKSARVLRPIRGIIPLTRTADSITTDPQAGWVFLMGKNARKEELHKRLQERLAALQPLDRLVVSMMLELNNVELQEKDPKVAESKKRLIEQKYETIGRQTVGKSVEQRRSELSEKGRQLLSIPKSSKL
jgi:ABC-type branched-subunit amino acid transport system ATPase component